MNTIMKRSIYLTLFLTFLLGSYNGYIALWRNDSPDPARVFPYRTIMLPPADRQALEKGIPIENSAELARLLEDYLS